MFKISVTMIAIYHCNNALNWWWWVVVVVVVVVEVELAVAVIIVVSVIDSNSVV
jgi:hypothetical protein